MDPEGQKVTVNDSRYCIQGEKKLVAKEASADKIYAEAKKEGMKGLFENGLEAVANGITTPDEIFRAIISDQT